MHFDFLIAVINYDYFKLIEQTIYKVLINLPFKTNFFLCKKKLRTLSKIWLFIKSHGMTTVINDYGPNLLSEKIYVVYGRPLMAINLKGAF